MQKCEEVKGMWCEGRRDFTKWCKQPHSQDWGKICQSPASSLLSRQPVRQPIPEFMIYLRSTDCAEADEGDGVTE